VWLFDNVDFHSLSIAMLTTIIAEYIDILYIVSVHFHLSNILCTINIKWKNIIPGKSNKQLQWTLAWTPTDNFQI